MRSVWHSLAWKEWHEHKWKLTSFTAIMWGAVALMALTGALNHDGAGIIQFAIILCIIPVCVFVGSGAAAGERSQNTLPFLQALPVPLWRVALHKVAFGLLTVVIPVLLTMLLIIAWSRLLDMIGAGYRSPLGIRWREAEQFLVKNWLVDTALTTSIVASSLFIWAAAFGLGRKDEVSAGAISLVAILGWWLVLSLLWRILLLESTGVETVRLRTIAVGTAPAGVLSMRSVADKNVAVMLAYGLPSAVIVHILLAAWYVKRFGQDLRSEIRSPRGAVATQEPLFWLDPPRRSPVAAIAWKQLRESGPIALLGLASIVGMSVLIVILVSQKSPDTSGSIAVVAIIIGFAIAMVMGIGVSHTDTAPTVNTFWRSRPINPDLWFWTKLTTSLAVLIAVMFLPLVLEASQLTGVRLVDFFSEMRGVILALVAIFFAALMMSCLVRHAVYAAILSTPVLYLGLLSVWLANRMGQRLGWVETATEHFHEMTTGQAAVAMAINIVVCTLVAWLATRYDWGRKSRY